MTTGAFHTHSRPAHPIWAPSAPPFRGETDEDDAPYLMAEEQHWAIIEALGLPPQALTTAFRHCDPADFPAAVVLE